MENNPEMAEATNQAYQASVDYLLEASGVEAHPDEKNGGEPTEDSENQSSQIQYSEDGEIVSTNPIQHAKQIYTGIDAQPQRVTVTTDMMKQMQNMANVLTNAVVGASVQLDFAPGEREKLIEIETIDRLADDKKNHADYASVSNYSAGGKAPDLFAGGRYIQGNAGFHYGGAQRSG